MRWLRSETQICATCVVAFYSARGLIRPVKIEMRWLQGRCGMSMRFVGLDETSALRATSLDSQACAYIDGKWGAVSL